LVLAEPSSRCAPDFQNALILAWCRDTLATVTEPDESISTYGLGAAEFGTRWEALSAPLIWAPIRDLLVLKPGGLALDIGAGSGRDAAWLASLGLNVVAAEPAEGMRGEGLALHPELRWVDDRLPELATVHRLGLSFDLVLLSAVWMHLRPQERPRAFRKMATLLKPGGVLVLTLRHGPSEPGRPMYEVSLGEVEALARDHGLAVLRAVGQPDLLGRADVNWTTVCLRLPDDGSMGLPLLRGIILNDNKSATYKLGLLRSIAKIADASPSMATGSVGETDRVSVPLGLVALNWIRGYLPLVGNRLPQMPGNAGPDGLGFAKHGFRALMDLGVTAQDLRIGASFAGDRANAVFAAIRAARSTIVTMPVRYTTMPNSDAQVFQVEGGPSSHRGESTLTPEVLGTWGQLSMPGPLWRTMLRLGAWIEPLLIAEWARLIRGWGERMGMSLPPGAVEARLVWQEQSRDTTLARSVAQRLLMESVPIRCVWSGAPLRIDTLDIDHAVPWSAWPCGDLWNLMPALRRVNQHEKRDRLPSSAVLARARDPILAWWKNAWETNGALAARFEAEAKAALPIEGQATPDAVFAGLEWRRLRVQQDQQAPEWSGRGKQPSPSEALPD
jgi:SAM-dependent methyltransferase